MKAAHRLQSRPLKDAASWDAHNVTQRATCSAQIETPKTTPNAPQPAHAGAHRTPLPPSLSACLRDASLPPSSGQASPATTSLCRPGQPRTAPLRPRLRKAGAAAGSVPSADRRGRAEGGGGWKSAMQGMEATHCLSPCSAAAAAPVRRFLLPSSSSGFSKGARSRTTRFLFFSSRNVDFCGCGCLLWVPRKSWRGCTAGKGWRRRPRQSRSTGRWCVRASNLRATTSASTSSDAPGAQSHCRAVCSCIDALALPSPRAVQARALACAMKGRSRHISAASVHSRR